MKRPTQYTALRKRRVRQVATWGVSQTGKHYRVYSLRGKACEHTCPCGKRAENWANLTGDYNDIYDYEAMCISCHRRYDDRRTA